jgi:hypothetical protein
MVQTVITWVKGLIEASRASYGVDPIIFFIISTVASPLFYYSIYRLVRAVVKKNVRDLMLWGPLFGIAFIAPYVYVLFFGHNLPWWVYVVIGLLVAQGAYSVVRKIQGKKKAEAAAEAGPADAPPRPPGQP